MPPVRSRHCQCPERQSATGQPHQQYQLEVAVFLATLNHEQRRLYAAVEANRLGRGGVARVVELTGIGNPTVARGRRELSDLLQGKALKKEPHPVGGRPRTEEKYPAITGALEELLSDEVAGNPEGKHQWVRSSGAKLTARLRERRSK